MIGMWVLAAAVSVGAAGQSRRPQPTTTATATERITVYRSPTCGCCGKWVEHLKAAGFVVIVQMVENIEETPARRNVPHRLRSCHTGVVAGYTVEGHVPADVIKQILRTRPAIVGLAVAGMPAGSPGMESPHPQPYDVIAFDKAGGTSVFARR